MMQRLLHTLILVLAFLCTPAAWAQDVEASGAIGSSSLSYTLIGSMAAPVFDLVITGQGAMPAFTDGTQPWAAYQSRLARVSVGEGVTTIGDNAFRGATTLQTVELPSTLTRIGASAFADCSILSRITFESATCPTLALDGSNGPFKGAGSDNYYEGYIYIPYGTTAAYRSALITDSNLGTSGTWNFVEGDEPGLWGDNITWTYNATTHTLRLSGEGEMADAFSAECEGMSDLAWEIEHIQIGDGITHIGADAFGGFRELRYVDFPSNPFTIGTNAFTNCYSLERISIPAQANIDGAVGLFSMCTALQSVTFEGAPTTLPASIFADCPSLTTFTIPASVTTIGAEAFSSCYNLRFVEFLGSTMPAIGNGVFAGVASPGYASHPEGANYSIDPFPSDWTVAALHQYPDRGLYWYVNSREFCIVNVDDAGYNYTVPSNYWTDLDRSTLPDVESVSIGDGVSTLGEGYFPAMPAVMNISIPASLDAVPDELFHDKPALASISVGDGNLGDFYTSDDGHLYQLDGSFVHLVRYLPTSPEHRFLSPENLKSVGPFAFEDAQQLDFLIFNYPYADLDVPATAFDGMASQVTVLYKSLGNTSIPAATADKEEWVVGAGGECGADESEIFYINDPVRKSVSFVGNGAIRSVSDHTDLPIALDVEKAYFSDDITYVSNVLNSKPSLREVHFGSGLSALGRSAFAACTALEQVIFPASLTSIDDYAFGGCSKLAYIEFEGTTAPALGSSIFSGLPGRGMLKIPATASDEAFAAVRAALPRYWFDFARGNFGEGLAWTFDGECFTLDGEGKVDSSVYSFPFTDDVVSIVITGGNIEIGSKFFADCPKLKEISLKSSRLNLGGAAFKNCPELVRANLGSGYIELANGYSDNSAQVFAGSRHLTTINITDLAKWNTLAKKFCEAICFKYASDFPGSEHYGSINRAEFTYLYNGEELTTFRVPEELAWLREMSLYGFTKLETLYLPATLGAVDIYALPRNVKTVQCNTIIPPFVAKDLALDLSESTLRIPPYTLDHYTAADGWKDFGYFETYKAYTLNEESLRMATGDSYQLEIAYGAEDEPAVIEYWKTSDDALADVDMEGLVTIVGDDYVGGFDFTPGEVVVSAVLSDGQNVSCTIQQKTTATLTDGTSYQLQTAAIFEQINYCRNFSHNKWQALYIPFALDYDSWADDFEVAYLSGIHQYDTDDDGEIDDTIFELIRLKRGSTKPNTPYLIRALEAGPKTITVYDDVLYAATVTEIELSTWDHIFRLCGTYYGVSGKEMYVLGLYALGGGAFVQAESPESALSSYRWYIDVTRRDGSTQSLKQIKIRVVGEEADGITTLYPDDATPVETLSVYDLCGRACPEHLSKGSVAPVQHPTAMPGIRIVGGKKVLK